MKNEAKLADAWNARHPIGTLVRFWPGLRMGDGQVSRTRTAAELLYGTTAVLWVESRGDCIALTHIEAITEAATSGTPGGRLPRSAR